MPQGGAVDKPTRALSWPPDNSEIIFQFSRGKVGQFTKGEERS